MSDEVRTGQSSSLSQRGAICYKHASEVHALQTKTLSHTLSLCFGGLGHDDAAPALQDRCSEAMRLMLRIPFAFATGDEPPPPPPDKVILTFHVLLSRGQAAPTCFTSTKAPQRMQFAHWLPSCGNEAWQASSAAWAELRVAAVWRRDTAGACAVSSRRGRPRHSARLYVFLRQKDRAVRARLHVKVPQLQRQLAIGPPRSFELHRAGSWERVPAVL